MKVASLSAAGSRIEPRVTAVRPASASPLLDRTESIERVRPLRAWTNAQMDAVGLRFSEVHRDWCASWLPAHGAALNEVQVEVSEDEDSTNSPSQGAVCWAFTEDAASMPRRTAIDAITRALFDFERVAISPAAEVPVVATSVVRAAWADWLQRLGSLLAGHELVPQEQRSPLAQGISIAVDPWSGALRVHWAWCGGRWSLGIPQGAVAALLADEPTQDSFADRTIHRPTAPPTNGPPKLPLVQALEDEPVVLRVMLAGAELSLGQLQGLRHGDVVPLDHPLDAPLQVVGADGTSVCDGWLGQSDGHIAVELVLPSQAPPPLAVERPSNPIREGKNQ